MNIIDISDIDTKGFIYVKNFIDEGNLLNLKNQLDKFLPSKNNFNKIDNELENTLFFDFHNQEEIKNIVKKIFNKDSISYSHEDCYKVLRVLTGNNSDSQNKNLHFDSYYLTLMFSIKMPENIDENNGSFLIIPNVRIIFKYKILNNLIKFIFQNRVSKFLYRFNLFDSVSNIKNIKPEEGSLLIFRGAKSLHGSGNLLKNTKRVTMLYHFKKM